MKKIFIVVLCFICIFLTACGKNLKKVEPNQNLSDIKYYVPSDYKKNDTLRGMLYNDETRKLFAKGDISDYNSFYYVDMMKTNSNGKKLDDYINEVNTMNLKDGDIKFSKFDNDKLSVYERSGYETKNGDIKIINYAYITQIGDSFYGLTISGPKKDQDSIKEIAKMSAYSMQK